MKLLADWTIRHRGGERKIELLQGDLARLPPEHAVDVLIVSAFPNDYRATPKSLIGALEERGLSILKLSWDKQADLRQQYSCWLSKPVSARLGFNFRHILCIESGWRGTPPQITDDLFGALAPYLLTDFPNSSVAMPLIGAGDQGWPPEEMFEAILRAAVDWIERGLPLRLLKIVVVRKDTARKLVEIFEAQKERRRASEDRLSPEAVASPTAARYDVFLSYAHEDAEIARYVTEKLRQAHQNISIFYDQSSVQEGTTWLMKIAVALELVAPGCSPILA